VSPSLAPPSHLADASFVLCCRLRVLHQPKQSLIGVCRVAIGRTAIRH
jgi:hypothetical protein